MRQSAPLISVIVPFHNDGDYIADCLFSIQNQRDVAVEIVAIDDCGGDDSADIVTRAASDDERVRVFSHDRNRGLAAARNSGLAWATGDVVTFLDADDFIFPGSLSDRLTCLLETADGSAEVGGSFCSWQLVPEAATVDMRPQGKPHTNRVTYMSADGENPFIATAPLLWREAALSVGGFDEAFDTAEDFDFWIRILRQGYEFNPTGTVGVAYRQKRTSMISSGTLRHAVNASKVYDYMHRPLHPFEVAPDAPEPYLESVSDHRRIRAWLGRLAAFLVLARGAGDEDDAEGLLGLLMPGTSLRDLYDDGVLGMIDTGIKRLELKVGKLPKSERNAIRVNVIERLALAIEAAPQRGADPGALPQADRCRVGSLDPMWARERARPAGPRSS